MRATMTVDAIGALLLAGVFVVSAWTKLRHPRLVAIAARELLGMHVPGAIAPLLIATELATAMMLAMSSTRRVGAVVALVLLATFSAVIARSLKAGRTPACACFGSYRSAPISSLDLIRNAALGLLALVAFAG